MSTTKQLIRLSSNEAYLRYSQITTTQNQDHAKWLEDCNNNERFFQGGENQWTPEELEALQARGNYTITMDMTRKAIMSMVGMLTANKPVIKCIPVNKEDNGKAAIRNMQLDQTWRDSDGLLRIREIMLNAYKCNIAYAFVMPYRNRVNFRMLTYNEVLVERSSTDPMFRDAEWIVVRKWIPVERVKAMYGVESLNTTFPTDWSTAGFVETEVTHKLFDQSRRHVLVHEMFKKILVKDDNGDLRQQIVRETLIGYEYLYRDVMPKQITEYPIIPLYSGISTNPLKFSELHYMKEPQRFINKMYNVTIMNAQATGSPKVFVHSTDIPNEDIQTFANNYAIPGSVNELNPGAEAPVVINAQPLSQAYYTLYQDATQYLFRIYSALGLDGQATDSSTQGNGATLYEKREAVMDSLKTTAGIFEAFLKQLSKSVLEHWSAYVSKEQIVRVCEALKQIQAVEADMQQGLDVKNPEIVAKWSEMMKQKGMPDGEIQQYLLDATERSEFIDAVFDTLVVSDDLDYDIEIVEESYAPTYQASKFNVAMMLAEKGFVDGETILELSPIDDKEKIIRRLSIQKQLQSQLEMMQEELDKTKQELESREGQIKDMMIKSVGIQEKARFDYQYKNDRVNSQAIKKAMNADRTEKARQLDYDIKNFMLFLKENKEQLKNTSYDDVVRMINIG